MVSWLSSVAIAVGFVTIILAITYTMIPEGWRTYGANAISGVILAASLVLEYVNPVLEYLSSVPFHEALEPKTALMVALGVNIMNIVCKTITVRTRKKKGLE